ncbi:MAG TPA: hypothetical protein VNE58_16975 [Casimicrobiaceae bacterium]|nr:hypothetical protein [Casimicrobiaceae bacterium]
MATQQGSSGTQGGTDRDRLTGRQSETTSETGVRDSTYNLISVIYHALQGAETYKMYEEDVERTQDVELAQFFRQAHEQEKQRAQQGKQLLTQHLQRQSSGGGSGGQQLQSGSSGQQGGSRASGQQWQGGASTQSGGSSNQQSQAVPGDQYGNTQSSSTRGSSGGGFSGGGSSGSGSSKI